ncbi:MAG: sugar-binding domain-containing protein [Acidimicrobiales bacterium]
MFGSDLVEAGIVAKRYYIDGKTKTEIATELGMSRFRVARILEKAIAEGVIRIEITMPPGIDIDLSDRLRANFGLNHAVVVTTPNKLESSVREQLGKAAADLLSAIVSPTDVLGISWGRTLDAMITWLSKLAPCPIVQLTGVLGSITDSPLELVRRAAAISGGTAFPIIAPLVVSDAETAASFRKEPRIAAALSLFPKVTKATVAIGSFRPPNSQLRDALSKKEQEELTKLGVCAEFCGVFLNDDGKEVCHELTDRCIAATFDDLRRIPEVIAVAGGHSKQRAIRAALRAGILTSLVTDVGVARALLAERA